MVYSDYISRPDAVDLIAARTCPIHEKKRAWKNKINGQLKYQIKTGKITVVPPQNNEQPKYQNKRGKMVDVAKDKICFLDLSVYAKQRFPGLFDDWPTKPVVGKVSFSSSATLGAHCCVFTNNLEQCHQQILSLDAEVQQLKQIQLKLQSEIERLKQAAERYWEICEKNSRSSSKCQ